MCKNNVTRLLWHAFHLTNCWVVSLCGEIQCPSACAHWLQGERRHRHGDRGQGVNRAIPGPTGALRCCNSWRDLYLHNYPQTIQGYLSHLFLMLTIIATITVIHGVSMSCVYQMWNHSKTCIFFQWERMNSSTHIIEVEPSTGRIGVSHSTM